tara:strand:+ start:232 stop:618 length:387 start_codon:yes stop_codon:yes gene_type:complete
MKITKAQLKEIILEAINEEYGWVDPLAGNPDAQKRYYLQLGDSSKAHFRKENPDYPYDEWEQEAISEEKKKKPPKDGIPFDKLKKGRCTPMGTSECPEGSPQYNLAKAFKGKIRQSNLKRGKNPHGPG